MEHICLSFSKRAIHNETHLENDAYFHEKKYSRRVVFKSMGRIRKIMLANGLKNVT